MKNLILILSVIVLLSSCKSCKEKEPQEAEEQIEKEVTISFLLRSGGGVACEGEWCGSYVNIQDGEGMLKTKYQLPDSITAKWEWWNREYIATIKLLDETCHCKDAHGEPYPPGSTDFPEMDLKMVEILKIREKI